MNIEEGHLLRFIPPILDGNVFDNKKRYMLVINYDNQNNIIKMINISSIKGKEHKLLYDSNIEIKEYMPLPVPTFAKLDTLYTIDNFEGLQNFISFDGEKMSESEMSNIKLQRFKYIKDGNTTNAINFSESEFKKINNISI